MKHLLNNISEEEKNSILEQHGGGMKIFNENFHKMVNKKLGHVDLYEQTDTTKDSSTENTRKLSDISQDKLGSSNDVRKEAIAIVGDKSKINQGLAALRLFQKVSNKIYELNKDNEESKIQVLYMGDKNNPSGERFRGVINKYFEGDNTKIASSGVADKALGGANYNYGQLKEFLGNDQKMAKLYNTWLDTKI